MIHDNVHVCPRAKLPLPVGDGGQRGDDEEGATDPHVEDLVQKGDGLDGLSQTHLVCQDAVFSTNSDSVREQETAEEPKFRKYFTFMIISTTTELIISLLFV